MYRSHSRASVVMLFAFALSACSGGQGGSTATPPLTTLGASNVASAVTDGSATRHASSASQTVIALDSGGSSAANWVADTDYNGGWTAAVTAAINTGNVAQPAPQAVYQSQRLGTSFSYTIPNLTANGAYGVTLHFVETFFGSAGQRLFNVTINGAQVLTNFDIFAAAGGQNIALAKQFNTTADGSGRINISFNASANNAAISGIAITTGATSAPAPAPTNPPSSGRYPIYSSSFTGNTPFHHTVASLLSAGAQVLSSNIARNYWAEGVGNSQPASQGGGGGPLYTAAAGDPAYVFSCPTYGLCNANGMVVHFPAGAHAQSGSDHHLNTFDPVYLHGEVDGWGGDGNSNHACNLNGGNPGSATCSWGGFYPFSGSGLATAGNSGDAGGYAFGLMNVTAQELLQGHIDHALGMSQSCLDDGGVYPSTPGRNSDAHCPSNEEPNARYGQLVHVKSSVDVNSLGYSPYCRVIVQAMQTYGAYTADNNSNWGLAVNLEFIDNYSGSNPWYDTVFPSIVAGGDGSGSGSGFSFNSCLNRLSANDIEIIQISTNLPPA